MDSFETPYEEDSEYIECTVSLLSSYLHFAHTHTHNSLLSTLHYDPFLLVCVCVCHIQVCEKSIRGETLYKIHVTSPGHLKVLGII